MTPTQGLWLFVGIGLAFVQAYAYILARDISKDLRAEETKPTLWIWGIPYLAWGAWALAAGVLWAVNFVVLDR